MRLINLGFASRTLAVCALLAIGGHPVSTNAAIRVFAVTGQPAPGTSGVFAGPPGVTINDNGDVAFFNYVHDNTTPDVDNTGIWAEIGGGGVQLVAHVGDQAPGMPAGVLFDGFCCASGINNAGQVAFKGSLARGAGGITFENNSGLWLGSPNNVHLVAQRGDAAIGTANPPRTFISFFTPSLNNVGDINWYSQLNPGVDSGLWSEAHGSRHMLASTMSAPLPAPGAQPLALPDSVPINDAGETPFYVVYRLNANTLDEKVRGALWLDRASGLQLVAAPGQPAPGLSGAIFESAGDLSGINHAGQVVFQGDLQVGPGEVTAANNSGIGAGSVDNLRLIVRRGDPAPGLPGAPAFSSAGGSVINHSGQVLFRARTEPSPAEPSLYLNLGVWKHDGNQLQLIAREGQQAPGAPDGVVYKFFDLLSMNAAGQAIFRGIVGPCDDDSGLLSWTGLWAQDITGVLRLIARPGDQIDVDNGPGVNLLTVESIQYFAQSGGEDGRYRAINDRGQIAFSVIFTDHSAAGIISDVVAVPEPGLAMIAICGLFIARTRRCRTLC